VKLPYALLEKLASRIIKRGQGREPLRFRHHQQAAGDD